MWLPPATGRLCGCPAGRRGEDLEVFFSSLFNKGIVCVVPHSRLCRFRFRKPRHPAAHLPVVFRQLMPSSLLP